MRAVVQRTISAEVAVRKSGEEPELETVARIGTGLLILVGVRSDDTDKDAVYLAQKVANLRIFEDEAGKLNRSLIDIGGEALAVSNFTLYGDCRSGRRPSFTEAGSGEEANRLCELFIVEMQRLGVPTQCGVFGAEMQVSLVNDGPVTLLVDSRKQF